MASIILEIVTAEKVVYSESIDILVVPGIEGELAILPGHTALLTALKPGEIRVIKDGSESFMAVSGGFLEVMRDKVTILAEQAERSEEIDLARAEEALRRAEGLVATSSTDLDLQRALASLRRSRARISVGRRRRRDTRAVMPGSS